MTLTQIDANQIADAIDAEAQGLFAIPHTFEIRPDMHAQAVAVAAERARQEMFEACVKADCLYCKNDTPKQEGAYWIHYGRQNCHALALRRAFPERSAAMNARATRTLALGD